MPRASRSHELSDPLVRRIVGDLPEAFGARCSTPQKRLGANGRSGASRPVVAN
jgi:hypothetical protein